MTVTAPAYSARILGTPDVPVSMRSDAGSISLDVADAPHVTAQVTLTMPDAGLLDDLDPRDGRRLVIEAGGRTFDLGVREAKPDRAAGTVGVSLSSDEALLDDFSQLVDDRGPRAHEASLRGVTDYVLGKIGAGLEPGGPDTDVTAFWPVTNLLSNPSIEVNTAGWAAGSGASALSRIVMSSPVAPAGTAALRWTAAAGLSNVLPASSPSATTDFRAEPGRWYVFTFYIVSTVARQAAAAIQWWSSNGTVLSGTSVGQVVVTNNTSFQRLHVIAQAPAGASHAMPYVQTTGNAAGNQHFVDCAMFYEGDELIDYFDPSMTVPGYEVTWAAAAHGSTSQRIPDVERPPSALVWRAGTSGLEFLRPLLVAAGLRLVCNERREWTLRDNEYREPGVQTFRIGVNIVAVDEELSREDDAWFDGMVARYTWTDDDGIEQTHDDTFALTPTPTKVVLREIAAPYPGPGRAEYAVRRAQGKGRTITATRQATWTEAAEQNLSVLLDGTEIQTGTAEKVVFDLARNEVTTTSRTTDTPAAAWVLIPTGETWLDSPAGASWIGEVI